MPVIKLTPKEWAPIRQAIKEEFKLQPAVFLVRDAMRRELGFTTRYHRYWKSAENTLSYDGHGEYVEEVHLDFYDELSETMFRLKYL